MKKTPTLFLRDFDTNPKHVTSTPNPDCSWVFDGEGKATRKYDGTCCMFDGQDWFMRREVKPGKKAPDDFIQINHDPNTGKLMGWRPAGPEDYWLIEAMDNGEFFTQNRDFQKGTYELCGPKVQGNPERLDSHFLIPHAKAEILEPPRNFIEMKEWMREINFEGVVFHHEDGRMAKIKRRDFNLRPEAKLEPDVEPSM